MESDGAARSGLNWAVSHISAANVAVTSGHYEHAKAQLAKAAEWVDLVAEHVDDQLKAKQEAAH